jgi:hypothetical protein
VARLIADDPQWRATYELLAPGMTAVGDDLHALGAEPEIMPADLAVRLDEAFRSPIALPTVIDPELAEPSEPHLEPVRGDRHLSVVPGGDGPVRDRHLSTEPGSDSPVRSRRRKRARWAVPVAAAAGVLAFAGLGIDYLAGQTGASDDQATSTAAGNAEQAAPMMGSDAPGPAPALREGQILETGTNYTAATLAAAAPAGAVTDSRAVPKAEASRRQRVSGLAPGELDRLRAPDALQACIDAIAQANAGGPITVETVDYARYTGRPALVVRFTSAGVSWAYAAGPNCGTPDLGADLVERVQVR